MEGAVNLNQSLEDTSSDEDVCKVCNEKFKNPRVVSCLHVYCQACIDQNSRQGPESSKVFECKTCLQETTVPSGGASSLSPDYLRVNVLDMSTIALNQPQCTSCKQRDTAVAHCIVCSNFLCSQCNVAHQNIRCFDNHKVVVFEELEDKNPVRIHLPIMCTTHPTENLKLYCHTCQTLLCSECTTLHLGNHKVDRLADIETTQIDELKTLLDVGKSRLNFCDEGLNDLQLQYESSKSCINETYQSLKAALEKQRDELLKELEEQHLEQELKLMESLHTTEDTMTKMEDACKYTGRLLEHGNALEILSLKSTVTQQLNNLIRSAPKPERTNNLDCSSETTTKKFVAKLREDFEKEEPSDSANKTPTETEARNGGSALSGLEDSHSSGISVSVTNSLSSSLSSSLPSPELLTSIHEYNLQQLASLAETNEILNRNSPASFSDLLGDYSRSSQAMNNLQALAKLGNIPISEAGDQLIPKMAAVSLNDQVVGGGNTGINGLGAGNPPNSLNGMTGGPLVPGSGAPPQPPIGHPRGPSPNLDLDWSNTAGLRTDSDQDMLQWSLFQDTQFPRVSGVKVNPMQIRHKFGQLGSGWGQFNSPHGFCLGIDEDIVVADTNNHRIQVFDKTGEFKQQYGVPGKEEGQLWYPRKVAVFRPSGKFVVCDRGNERSRMQIFTKNGHFVKKIAIRYIDIVAGLAITNSGHIVAVDSVSPAVFIIAENGEIVRWFDCSDWMREPSDITIAASGKEFYVCDFKGHCVVVFDDTGKFLRRIGSEVITNYPNGIDISDAGDILVGDSHGNRFHVAVFNREGNLLSEFECPYVKVSRCCGLQITSEGYVITLAKNNHHVLTLNTLYIQ